MSSQRKKVLVGVAVLLCVLVVLAAVVPVSSPSHKKDSLQVPPVQNDISDQSSQAEQSNSMPIYNQSPTRIPTPSLSAEQSDQMPQGWTLSDDDAYTFKYPENWTLERTLFANGQTVVVKPVDADSVTYAPSWSITIEQTDPNNLLSDRENAYEGFGFAKSMMQLSDQSFESLSGIFPPVAVGQIPDSSTVQETHVFLDSKPYSYLIVYKYPGVKKDPVYESMFAQITKSLSIETF
jgi:hypothetical protein